MNLKVYSHFHKEFPINRNSSWLVPTFAASSEAYGHSSLPSGYTNVTAFGGGINKFNQQIINDKIKKEYCYNNNIPLIIIKYNENVNDILDEKLLVPTNGFL